MVLHLKVAVGLASFSDKMPKASINIMPIENDSCTRISEFFFSFVYFFLSKKKKTLYQVVL